MSMDSPLFLTKVECPVCGTVNEFETIRVGAYTEGDRETDFCPSFIKWRNPKYQKYHPLLFFTATCSSCYYTREFNHVFKEWGKDNNFRTYRLKVIKERHLDELSRPDSFIKLVGSTISLDDYPDESAILKLLLATFDEQLNDHPSQLDLGRFYLRIAWLFRYINAGTETAATKPVPSHLENIERASGDLQNWAAGLDRNSEYLKNAIEAYLEQNAAGRPDDDAEVSAYRRVLEAFTGLGTQAHETLDELAEAIKTSKMSAGVSPSSDSGAAFHSFSNFTDYLNGLKRVWEGVPSSEFEATRLGVKHYITAFESGKNIARGNQSIQAAYLIGELSRRVGDHDTARQYFNTTIKTGQAFINEIRGDRTRTALARKILELAMKQGKKNLAEAK